jgi:hypothetical protein
MSDGKQFSLSAEQFSAVKEWMAGHKKRYSGAIGGRYSYTFTPTGLGVIAKITDNATGEVLDVTDYDGW